MTDDIQLIEALEAQAVRREGRRAFFKAALGAAAIGAGGFAVANAVEAQTAPSESDVLNFALNLEYLEANFYSYAVYGTPIDPTLTASGSGTAGIAATGGKKVDFSTDAMLLAMATEIAEDELAHVKFLRRQLGTAAVAQPALDIGVAATGAFSLAAQAATVVAAGTAFDPYSSLGNFLLGAFLFEDVGATAYRGAAPLLTTKTYIDATAGLMSTEAQHAAMIRTQLYIRGITVGKYIPADATQAANVTNAGLISDARDKLDGTTDLDQGITGAPDSAGAATSNIAPLSSEGLGFSRTTGQVLNIVYLNSGIVAKGGFFPSGVNGKINTSTAAA